MSIISRFSNSTPPTPKVQAKNHWAIAVSLLLLLLSHFSRVRLCATPQTAAHQAPPSLGRTLEWVAISFSNALKWKVKVKSLSRFWLFMTPWTTAYQAPPSMGFSRQEYWSGLHCLLQQYLWSVPNFQTDGWVLFLFLAEFVFSDVSKSIFHELGSHLSVSILPHLHFPQQWAPKHSFWSQPADILGLVYHNAGLGTSVPLMQSQPQASGTLDHDFRHLPFSLTGVSNFIL